jgi:hypothetical protein
MHLLKPTLIYFALVFGTGFFLGTIRVLWVAPRVGDRTAQLIEMPVMLAAIFLAARLTTRSLGDRGASARIAVGLLALGLMLAAEIAVGVALRGESPAGALFSRDPVSGTAYYLALGAFALMPWLLGGSRGGRTVRATKHERGRPLPGDEFVAGPIGSVTHAVTIRRAPRDVWPWLLQMGAGRAGWYSYDVIDNGGRNSADRILPQFQTTAIGTLFPAIPGATDAFMVVAYEQERFFILGWVPGSQDAPVTTWAFVLEEPEPGYTRLIEHGRVRSPYRPCGLPEWLAKRLASLAHAVMVRKHLLGIARRAQGRESSPPNQPLQPTGPAVADPGSSGVAQAGPAADL